jgi:hypothetical protein
MGKGSSLHVRTTRVDITPRIGVTLGGRVGSRSSTKIHSRLEVNITVFSYEEDSCCIISIDTLYAGMDLTKAIQKSIYENFGILEQSVIIAASHTHSAPNLDKSKPNLGEVNNEYYQDVLDKVLAAIRQLKHSPNRPATIRVASRNCKCGVNRRLRRTLPRLTRKGLRGAAILMAPSKQRVPDPRVRCISLQDSETGEDLCFMWTLACHPTGFPSSHSISAEYVGAVRTAIRSTAQTPCTVQFLQGFSGDIKPPSGTRTFGEIVRAFVCGPRFVTMTLESWKQWTTDIVQAVLDAKEHATIRQPSVRCSTSNSISEIPLDALIDGLEVERVSTWKRLMLYEGHELLATNAEPVSHWCSLLRGRHVNVLDQWLVGCEGDVFGYLPTAKEIRQGGYEADAHLNTFGLQGNFQKHLETNVLKAVHDLRHDESSLKTNPTSRISVA